MDRIIRVNPPWLIESPMSRLPHHDKHSILSIPVTCGRLHRETPAAHTQSDPPRLIYQHRTLSFTLGSVRPERWQSRPVPDDTTGSHTHPSRRCERETYRWDHPHAPSGRQAKDSKDQRMDRMGGGSERGGRGGWRMLHQVIPNVRP